MFDEGKVMLRLIVVVIITIAIVVFFIIFGERFGIYSFFIPIPLSTYLISMNIAGSNAEGKLKKDSFVVRMPRWLIWVGIVGVLLFGWFLALTIVRAGDVKSIEWETPVIAAAFLSYSLGLYYCVRWRVTIDGETIEYVPAFGKKKVFTFTEISRTFFSGGEVYVYVNDKKVFGVNFIHAGYKNMMWRLRQEGKLYM